MQTELSAQIRAALRTSGAVMPADQAPPEIQDARRDLTAFDRFMFRRYDDAPHLRLINRALMDVARYLHTDGREGIGRLIIEAPPRHGKSLSTARLFPAWVLGRLPDLRVILASYGAQLSEKHSRYVRNLIASPVYRRVFPSVRLSADSKAVDAWDLAAPHEGGLHAVGKGGALTGFGGHLIITDDLTKSRAEAESELQREADWDWFTDDLLTRQEPHAAHIAIGTRYHLDDVLGRILLNDGDAYTVLRLPALAEGDDLLGRREGEALWAERFPASVIERQRAIMGEYSFAALYQQKPVPMSGGLFKRDQLTLIDHVPADLVGAVRFWDTAMSSKTTADYTVGVLLGMTERGRYVVLDVSRFRKEWGEVQPEIVRVAQNDGAQIPIGIEEVAYMSRAVQELLIDGRMHRYSVTGVKPDKDKLTRARAFEARVNAGLVDVYRGAWSGSYIDELCSFPFAAHDDQVDATTGAYLMLEQSVNANEGLLAGGLNYADDYGSFSRSQY